GLERAQPGQWRAKEIGKSRRQRIAVLVIGELLHQRAAESLGEPTDNLPLDQSRIDGAANVVGDHVSLDANAAGFTINPHEREMDAIGIDLVLDAKPPLAGKAALAFAKCL